MTPDSSTYEALYRDSNYGSYPTGSPRLDYVLAWVKKFVPSGATVLDYGAGRCYLTRRLLEAKYEVAAYEPCAWLWENDLADLAQHRIREQPWSVPVWSWDCVIASDVLEHLPTEADAVDLLSKLCGIARKWVIVTVGIGPSNAQSNLPGTNLELHTVLKPDAWWEKRIAKHLEIVEKAAIKKSVLYLGRKK